MKIELNSKLPKSSEALAPGALICAEIIMNGRATIETSYGLKRVEGIAGLANLKRL